MGPNAIKLFPLDGLLYCGPDFKTALQWHEQREHVTGGVQRMSEFDKDATLMRRYGAQYSTIQEALSKLPSRQIWRGYIEDLCAMAEFGLLHGDRRTFVHYFSRAMYAWTLKEIE